MVFMVFEVRGSVDRNICAMLFGICTCSNTCHYRVVYYRVWSRGCGRGALRGCIRGALRGCVRGYVRGALRECIRRALRGCVTSIGSMFSLTTAPSNASRPLRIISLPILEVSPSFLALIRYMPIFKGQLEEY